MNTAQERAQKWLEIIENPKKAFFNFGEKMITALFNTLKKYTNGRVMLVFLALNILFNMLIAPIIGGKLEENSGGTGPIDLLFSYTPEKVYSMIESYGDEARNMYRTYALTGDIIYPIVYSVFFGLLITWLFQRAFAPNSKMQMLNIIPFGAGLFDWLENINIATMLSLYPSKPTIVAQLSSSCTSIKWSLCGVSIALVLIGFVMALKNGFKKQ